MTFNEWIQEIIGSGLLCGEYTSKVDDAKSKKRLMDIVLDANGVSWLCEMDAKGMPLPYETILREFKGYINARYIAEYKNEKGNGYSSALYCCFSDSSDINIETTLTTVLGCKADVWVGANDFVKIYADKNCQLMIHCPETSRCIVEYWKGAKVEVDEPLGGKVELIEH